MTTIPCLPLGNRAIGPGHPVFIAAEIGINHNGDMQLAREMMRAARDAGADAVKFQNYVTEDFVLDRRVTHTYLSQGREVTESQHDMFKRYELSRDQVLWLKREADALGILFFSTPTGESGLRDLVDAGVPLLKNGSDLLVEVHLIAAMARTGLPTILSTGMATEEEMRDAVDAFRAAGGRDLLLLHCVSSYPTPPDQVNLRKIPRLAETFGVPVGFSDHTDGTVAALGAVAHGACFVEKHFTTDRNLPGPDHRFSSDPAELRALCQAIRTLEQCQGEAALGPTRTEALGRRDYRLSCVARRDLPAGHRLTVADIAFSRPAGGLPPKERFRLEGGVLARARACGEPILPADLTAVSRD